MEKIRKEPITDNNYHLAFWDEGTIGFVTYEAKSNTGIDSITFPQAQLFTISLNDFNDLFFTDFSENSIKKALETCYEDLFRQLFTRIQAYQFNTTYLEKLRALVQEIYGYVVVGESSINAPEFDDDFDYQIGYCSTSSVVQIAVRTNKFGIRCFAFKESYLPILFNRPYDQVSINVMKELSGEMKILKFIDYYIRWVFTNHHKLDLRVNNYLRKRKISAIKAQFKNIEESC